MKKIFTLLFSVGAFATSFAQSGHQSIDKKNHEYVNAKSNSDYKKIDDHRYGIYTFSEQEKNRQIDKINNDFNFKVKSIVSNRRIKKHEKKIMIQKAQLEKAQQIAAVNAKFDSKYNTVFNGRVKQSDKHRH